MTAQTYDVIVLGAGPAGEVFAGRLTQRDLAVAIVKSDLVGGECSFYACTPSTALLRRAQALVEARRVPGATQAVSGDLDVAAVASRRDQIVHGLDDSEQAPQLESHGVELIRGHGRLDGDRRSRVAAAAYNGRCDLAIAVGSMAAMPPLPGIVEVAPCTSREVTTSATIRAADGPRRQCFGLEMADAYASSGSTVTVLELGERLLAHEEPFAGDELSEALTERGVDVRTCVRATRVSRDGAGVRVSLDVHQHYLQKPGELRR